MDFSKHGVKEGLSKMASVLVYIVASAAIVALGMYVKNQAVTMNEIKTAVYLAVSNLSLVFLQKWLSTQPPIDK